MAAFIPGASPPLVRTAIFRIDIGGHPYTTTCGPPIRANLAFVPLKTPAKSRSERPPAGKPEAKGETNYITPVGFRKLADELTFLHTKKRPEVVNALSDAAAEGDRSENAEYIYRKRQLRQIDSRLRFLSKRLDIVEIVDPASQQRRDRVFFGATVTVEDEEGQSATYRIVGVDESDGAAGDISWKSPIGRALLGKALGDTVTARWHAGLRELTIAAIDYR
jgi:transcription elongation factor GreB